MREIEVVVTGRMQPEVLRIAYDGFTALPRPFHPCPVTLVCTVLGTQNKSTLHVILLETERRKSIKPGMRGGPDSREDEADWDSRLVESVEREKGKSLAYHLT